MPVYPPGANRLPYPREEEIIRLTIAANETLAAVPHRLVGIPNYFLWKQLTGTPAPRLQLNSATATTFSITELDGNAGTVEIWLRWDASRITIGQTDMRGLLAPPNQTYDDETDNYLFTGGHASGGVIAPHGFSHAFYTGTDPIPAAEEEEALWNNTAADAGLLDAVYESGAGEVGQALADVIGTMPVIGFVSRVIVGPPQQVVLVQEGAELAGFGAALVADAIYFASAAVLGGITNVPPNAQGNVRQVVGYAKTDSILVVKLGEPTIVGA